MIFQLLNHLVFNQLNQSINHTDHQLFSVILPYKLPLHINLGFHKQINYIILKSFLHGKTFHLGC